MRLYVVCFEGVFDLILEYFACHKNLIAYKFYT